MMIKSSLLKVFFTFILCFSQAKSSTIFEDYLSQVETKFNQASTPEEKFEIIARPINMKYLEQVATLKELDERKLGAEVSSDPLIVTVEGKECINYHKTTPLSIAVSLGRAYTVENFLKVVPDVMNPVLTAWGYRQPYTLGHMALDPQFPKASRAVSLKDRLAIVDSLGKRKADFNAIVRHKHMGVYENPPLSAGQPSGRELLDLSTPLRARALLYGADHEIWGSSFCGKFILDPYPNSKNKNPLALECLKQYLEKMSLGEEVSPHPHVLVHLENLAQVLGFDLKEIIALHQARHKTILAQQKNAIQIVKFKAQSTKKAKSKVSHLQQIDREYAQDLTKLNKELARLPKI